MRFQAIGIVPTVVAAGLALAACSAAGSGSAANVAATAHTPAPGAHASTPVEPQTAAAVRSDADDYLTLYPAGEFAIIYQMLSAPAREAIQTAGLGGGAPGLPGRHRGDVVDPSATSRSPARPPW